MQTTINNTEKLMAEVDLENAVNRLKKEVEMETWRRAEEMVVEKAEIIENLLYSNEAIRNRINVWGKNYDKMTSLRLNLMNKQRMLYQIASAFHKEWRKAARK